jgi:hypothetical protein
MAVVTVTTDLNQTAGVPYTVITDTSSDWASVSNDVYFFDKATKLTYYKNVSGTVVSLFEGDTFVTGGTYSGSTIILNRNDGNSVDVTGITSSNIYTANDTLTGDRTVDLGGNHLLFNNGSTNLYTITDNGGHVFDGDGSANNLFSFRKGGNQLFSLGSSAAGFSNQSTISFANGALGSNNRIDISLSNDNQMGWFNSSGTNGHRIRYGSFNHVGFFMDGVFGWRGFTVGGDDRIGTEDISLQGNTLITKQLELSTTTDGFLMPRLTTAQKNAISSPDTNLMVFDTDLSSLQRYNGTIWVALADGYGILGIASTGGNYTYYSTYTLAMTAAVAGETVEQFGNITETSNVTITIKDGVSINMNGYTYTTDGSTVGAFYHDDNGYEQTRFQNGTVKHINTGGVSNALSIGGESHMDCTGLIVISDGAYCLNFNTNGVQKGRLIGGSYIHTGGSGWNHVIEGNLYGAYLNTGNGAVRIIGGSLDNCRIDGSVFISSGILSNSRVVGGSYSHAISNEGTVFNTYASSALFRGISNGTNGIVENSTGISNASDGIYSVAGTVNNSRGKSTASYGIYMGNANAYANGCIAESSAAAAIRLNFGKIYNCKAICTFDDPSGDGILVTQSDGFEIIDCYATVVNSSAFAVDGTQSGVISGLKGRGMTALIGSTTNTLTNTTDAFNNGLIG